MSVTASLSYQPSSEANRRLVVQLLRQRQRLSRRQIAQITGLKGSTLTYIVRDLLEQRMVRTAGKRSSDSVGPKETLLEINPELGLSVGFDLRRSSALMVLCNATGEVLDESKLPITGGLDEVPAQLRAALDRRLEALPWARERKLLAVGVGIPGAVDAERGVVLNSMVFRVQNFPLRQLLALAFDGPVLAVDHNANLAAIAEARVGKAQRLSDFVYFLINYDDSKPDTKFKAFGAALFLAGRIYHGASFNAGELNHHLAPRVDGTMRDEDWAALADPDAPPTPFLEQLTKEVGQSIASIVCLLDPQAVIIGNNHAVVNRRFIAAIEATVLREIEAIRPQPIRVENSLLSERAIALGAAVSGLDAALDRFPLQLHAS